MSGSSYLNISLFTVRQEKALTHLHHIFAVVLVCSCSGTFASNLSSETSIDYTMHRLATEYNDPSAQYLVGRNYLKGKSVEKNIKEAIKWFEMAAKQNHIRAQYQLGKLYLYGKEIKTNLNFAFYYLSKAAEKNHLESQFELGNYYLKGNPNKRQHAKAADWYKRAAKRGHIRSMYELGKLLNEGMGVKQNTERAIKFLTEASESGLLEATTYLAKIGNTSTDTVNLSTVDAENNFDKHRKDSALTRQNDPNNQIDHYLLGIAYLTGDGKERNVYEAAQNFEIAARDGHGKAQYQLAKLYKQGIGVKQSSQLHDKWLKKAADAGVISAVRDLKNIDGKHLNKTRNLDDNPDTQYNLGMKHLSGDQTTKDAQKASKLFFKAAEKNHTKAQYQLGIMYEKAIGFKRDLTKAREWYQKAADSGSTEAKIALLELSRKDKQKSVVEIKPGETTSDSLDSQLLGKKSAPINHFLRNAKSGDRSAQYEVGIGYLNGEHGFTKDVNKGIDWLKTAANNHHTKAQTTLGLLYYQGKQVERDYGTATRWLEKSANEGDPEAQYTLGTIYQRGLGVQKNNTTAIMWYRKAANQGHRDARKQLGGCRIC